MPLAFGYEGAVVCSVLITDEVGICTVLFIYITNFLKLLTNILVL